MRAATASVAQYRAPSGEQDEMLEPDAVLVSIETAGARSDIYSQASRRKIPPRIPKRQSGVPQDDHGSGVHPFLDQRAAVVALICILSVPRPPVDRRPRTADGLAGMGGKTRFAAGW